MYTKENGVLCSIAFGVENMHTSETISMFFFFENMLILKLWYLRLRSVVNIPVFAVHKENETFKINKLINFVLPYY